MYWITSEGNKFQQVKNIFCQKATNTEGALCRIGTKIL